VLAVTPVKQQLKQFIEEMATINEDLDDHAPLKTVVMRGQADVLPYAHVDYHPFKDYSVTAKIDDLRQMTIELIRFGSDVPLDWPEDMDPPEWSNYTYDWSEPSDEASDARDLYKFDPNRAACVVQQLNQRVAAGEDPLVVDGVAAPYPDGIPHTSDVVDEKRLQRPGPCSCRLTSKESSIRSTPGSSRTNACRSGSETPRTASWTPMRCSETVLNTVSARTRRWRT